MAITFVVAIAAIIIYIVGRDVFAGFSHLSDEEMLAYWSGNLKSRNPRVFRRVSDHLGRCESCRDRFDMLRNEKVGPGPGADAPIIERKY